MKTSESKIYFDQPYAKITWIAEGNCLHILWKDLTSPENQQLVAEAQKQAIRTHGCTKLVFNTQALRKAVAQVEAQEYTC
jgi:hypothetical protein